MSSGTHLYLPAVPPPVPRAVAAYTRSVQAAPQSALMGAVVDQPDRHPISRRFRIRSQVGLSNRWRLPESLGGDLLGSAQAVKALSERIKYTPLFSEQAVELADLTGGVSGSTELQTVDSGYQSSANIQESMPASRKSGLHAKPLKFSDSDDPYSMFLYHSNRSQTKLGPDVILECCYVTWELHRPFLQKSQTLSQLLELATSSDDSQQSMPTSAQHYKPKEVTEILNKHIKKAHFYTSETKKGNMKTSVQFDSEKPATVLSLNVTEPLINCKALAIGLGHLYHHDIEVEDEDVVRVLAVAHLLKIPHLVIGCMKILQVSISCSTVCDYHMVALKYGHRVLADACQRWMELNLIPKLSSQIELKKLSIELIQKLLKSNRLFVYNEYSLYKVTAVWVYLHLNPHTQIMPSYSHIVSYFNSLPKATSLLECEEGEKFSVLFSSVRLHGITDTNHWNDLQTMNIISKTRVLKVISQQCQSLQAGGDMTHVIDFNSGAVRYGILLDASSHYESEVMSMHGFHFELKALRNKNDGSYKFYIKRLKPSDPHLLFRQCERYTFSLRPDRRVCYDIRVQWYDSLGAYHCQNTGLLSQEFGLDARNSQSQMMTVGEVQGHVYVMFSVFFPVS